MSFARAASRGFAGYFFCRQDPVRAALRRGFALGAIVVLIIEALVIYGRAASADAYAGAAIGSGTSADTRTYDAEVLGRQYGRAESQARGRTVQLFAGYRRGHVGGEVGALVLPAYSAYAEGLDPVRSTHQLITAHALYVRGMLWSQAVHDVRLYGFLGVARVRGANHEYGVREGAPVEHRNETNERPRYVGVGLHAELDKDLALRLELGHLPNAVRSHWTGDRAYRFVTVGVSRVF